ncbi:hypothetical protein COCMIDRAFT_8971 [Bipolaris oryzae ATCC 44560]|uniref:Uncharacterized protein n=1 Tax=Bipolaris oryzae ATCC 44560 TaxID=930090 RepID=W6YUP7_COCMI|nr:uncharacterized protein COCMIDRAFT_8971 [Bipolaris oryzae ATCC 44560]EUC41290.1 hypothetical protein COCMIDRAFT_8971 [Bipolaris oryzae ATCC 44560]
MSHPNYNPAIEVSRAAIDPSVKITEDLLNSLLSNYLAAFRGGYPGIADQRFKHIEGSAAQYILELAQFPIFNTSQELLDAFSDKERKSSKEIKNKIATAAKTGLNVLLKRANVICTTVSVATQQADADKTVLSPKSPFLPYDMSSDGPTYSLNWILSLQSATEFGLGLTPLIKATNRDLFDNDGFNSKAFADTLNNTNDEDMPEDAHFYADWPLNSLYKEGKRERLLNMRIVDVIEAHDNSILPKNLLAKA